MKWGARDLLFLKGEGAWLPGTVSTEYEAGMRVEFASMNPVSIEAMLFEMALLDMELFLMTIMPFGEVAIVMKPLAMSF